jgi:hypothetical protein
MWNNLFIQLDNSEDEIEMTNNKEDNVTGKQFVSLIVAIVLMIFFYKISYAQPVSYSDIINTEVNNSATLIHSAPLNYSDGIPIKRDSCGTEKSTFLEEQNLKWEITGSTELLNSQLESQVTDFAESLGMKKENIIIVVTVKSKMEKEKKVRVKMSEEEKIARRFNLNEENVQNLLSWLSKAKEKELIKRVGISKNVAKNIKNKQSFNSLTELDSIKGVGEKTIRDLVDYAYSKSIIK